MTVLALHVVLFFPLEIVFLAEDDWLSRFVISIIGEHRIIGLRNLASLAWTPQWFDGCHEVYLGFEEFLIAQFVGAPSIVGVRIFVDMVCTLWFPWNDCPSSIISMSLYYLLPSISIILQVIVWDVALTRGPHCGIRSLVIGFTVISHQALAERRLCKHIIIFLIGCRCIIVLLVIWILFPICFRLAILTYPEGATPLRMEVVF